MLSQSGATLNGIFAKPQFFSQKVEGTMQGYLLIPSYSTVWINMHLTQMETLSAFMGTQRTQYECTYRFHSDRMLLLQQCKLLIAL